MNRLYWKDLPDYTFLVTDTCGVDWIYDPTQQRVYAPIAEDFSGNGYPCTSLEEAEKILIDGYDFNFVE